MKNRAVTIGLLLVGCIFSVLPSTFADPPPHVPPTITLMSGYPMEVPEGSGNWEWRYYVTPSSHQGLSHLVIEIEDYCDPTVNDFVQGEWGCSWPTSSIGFDSSPMGCWGLKFEFIGTPDVPFEIYFTLNKWFATGSGGDGADGWGGIEVWFKSGQLTERLMPDGPDSESPFCIHEVPFGTISMVIAFTVALGLFRSSRSNFIKV